MSDRDPEHLHPAAREKCDLLQKTAEERLGIRTSLIETWRNATDQAAALASGASTKAAGNSWHNLTYPDGRPASFAFHLAVTAGIGLVGFGSLGLDWPAGKGALVQGFDEIGPSVLVLLALGLLGESLGLTWGGRWPHLRDYTHFELHPNGATLLQAKAALQANQDLAVWRP